MEKCQEQNLEIVRQVMKIIDRNYLEHCNERFRICEIIAIEGTTRGPYFHMQTAVNRYLFKKDGVT
jgi:hypothetical protein